MVYRACVLTVFLNPALCASFHLPVFAAFSQRENLCLCGFCPHLHGNFIFVHVVWFWARFMNIHVPNHASAGCKVLKIFHCSIGKERNSRIFLRNHLRLDIDTQERRIKKILQRSIRLNVIAPPHPTPNAGDDLVPPHPTHSEPAKTHVWFPSR